MARAEAAILPTEVFLDASYAIALASASDRHHGRAVEIAEQLEKEGTRLITTRAVALEIGNSLARQDRRTAATELLELLESDPAVEMVPLSEPLYHSALDLFRQRPDKDWGLTDCLSFVVMTRFCRYIGGGIKEWTPCFWQNWIDEPGYHEPDRSSALT